MALGRHVEGLVLDRHEEPADGAHRQLENRRLRALQVLEEPRRPGEVNWMTAGRRTGRGIDSDVSPIERELEHQGHLFTLGSAAIQGTFSSTDRADKRI